MICKLTRKEFLDKQTLGRLSLEDHLGEVLYECYTLELPWKDNERKVSCIPEGEYKVVPRWSAKFKEHFHILDVPNRTWILFHAGNYRTQIEGCILVGSGLVDINGDGYLDVTNSRSTLQKLVDLAPEGFDLIIEIEDVE